MSTPTTPAEIRDHLEPGDRAWLDALSRDLQLLADLDCADLVLWMPDRDGKLMAIAQTRPSSAPTLFYRDLLGQHLRDQWRVEAETALERGETVHSRQPDWFDELPAQLAVTPVNRRVVEANGESELVAVAVITRHTNLAGSRGRTRQEVTFRECAEDLFDMIVAGDFPDLEAPSVERRGAPRASDGLIRLDPEGIVTFASANALSAMNKLGFGGELEGESLVEVVSMLVQDRVTVDEATPLVVTGRAPWTTDIEVGDTTVTMRALPLSDGGVRIGAVVICRDTSDVRHQEQELLTKDATIREIHHRVKNNLQTVAALLRIQARRSRSDEARESLTQAMRRVASIAVVHDTLAGGFSQMVAFDEVFNRVLRLIAEVSSSHNTHVRPRVEGEFGTLPSEYATPLALALTELVTNAVEHGLEGQDGEVVVEVKRGSEGLDVEVRDTGCGFAPGRIGSGLGTQIIRTLVEGELGGTIEWHSEIGEGTRVELSIPRRWNADLEAAEVQHKAFD